MQKRGEMADQSYAEKMAIQASQMSRKHPLPEDASRDSKLQRCGGEVVKFIKEHFSPKNLLKARNPTLIVLDACFIQSENSFFNPFDESLLSVDKIKNPVVHVNCMESLRGNIVVSMLLEDCAEGDFSKIHPNAIREKLKAEVEQKFQILEREEREEREEGLTLFFKKSNSLSAGR